SGLSGLASRVEALGGTLRVDSPPGEGTRLEVSIPLSPWRDAREPFLEFGHEDDGGLGERLIDKVISGEKTAVISLAREWDLEGGPPRMGQRLPVMDHTGRRRATIEVVRMAGVPFGEITKDIVAAQTGSSEPLESWRAVQREYYDGCRDEIAVLLGEPGWRLTEDEPMIIVWFRVAD
ncbi:MAG TPA: ASCH domain-containing protein, partial [Thermoleophilaceae bacterium]